ncbi:hypothetical protein DFH08DRAFT_956560 [Mycena albidolilacea]|uniref:Uncharacterized protein n=1 Tax=Mycena albidolilacea TaxID=1033008 RepID=A0AAD7AAQ2_9AGAR|nr:hypothetical protein DFH08DRAFT_956560 [Mycena albidolilacea]
MHLPYPPHPPHPHSIHQNPPACRALHLRPLQTLIPVDACGHMHPRSPARMYMCPCMYAYRGCTSASPALALCTHARPTVTAHLPPPCTRIYRHAPASASPAARLHPPHCAALFFASRIPVPAPAAKHLPLMKPPHPPCSHPLYQDAQSPGSRTSSPAQWPQCARLRTSFTYTLCARGLHTGTQLPCFPTSPLAGSSPNLHACRRLARHTRTHSSLHLPAAYLPVPCVQHLFAALYHALPRLTRHTLHAHPPLLVCLALCHAPHVHAGARPLHLKLHTSACTPHHALILSSDTMFVVLQRAFQ